MKNEYDIIPELNEQLTESKQMYCSTCKKSVEPQIATETGSGFDKDSKAYICPDCGEDIKKEEMGESEAQKLIATVLASVSEGMAFLDPKKSEAKNILTAIRTKLGIDAVQPTWKEYLTVRHGSSNKYHYFAVFRVGTEFVATNAHGRIGYNPIVTEIGRFNSALAAVAACEKKSQHKQASRGYEPTKIFDNR